MGLSTNAYNTLVELRECLRGRIEDAGLAEPCLFTLMPGSDVPLDYCMGNDQCDNGMAWVRLVGIERQVVADGSGTTTCAAAFTANLEMGWMSGAPTLTEGGDLPTEEDQNAATATQMQQMGVMLSAFCGCRLSSGWKPVVSSYVPFGPQGGCVGGMWLASVAVD